MPNSGMLDHRAYSARRNNVHWIGSWPGSTGYHTMRFSKHLYLHAQKVQSRATAQTPSLSSRPSSASQNNSIAPFHTEVKPTCGFFFSNYTDNRKRRIGIPPTNLVAWRPTFSARTTRPETTAH